MTKKRPVGERRRPTEVDLLVGRNLRQLRRERGITLSETAVALNMSHQQLQKYETGANRISAGVLIEIAKYFAVPVGSLFEDPASKSDGDPSEKQLVRAKGKCHYIVDHERSPEVLNTMAKVLRALPAD
jgi:transcriptional regulator with XRE-family HTH domain